MTGKPLTVMALAAHHNRIGFCFLIGKQPMDWQLSFLSARSPAKAKAKAMRWIKFYSPDVVITEDIEGSQRKGMVTQDLIGALKDAALENDVQHIEARRTQPCANKYVHIDQLCAQFPQMKAIQPRKREIYDTEPPVITIFEALSLAKETLG